MFDGITATIKNILIELWNNNALLDFKTKVSTKTGLLSTTKTALLAGLNFDISCFKEPATCSIKGSLHTFKDRAGINYDRFTFVEVQKVVNELEKHFDINPKQTILRTLEIGININLKYAPDTIIKAGIIHLKQPPQQINKYKKYLGIQFVHNDYTIKIYDKGKQSGCKGLNILRFEIKARRMRYLKKYNIITLHDLTDRDKVEPLINELIKAANEILFFDYNAKTNLLTPKEREQWNQYSNPNYWNQLNKSQTYKAKKRFKTLAIKINAIDFNKQLCNWIEYEWKEIFKPQSGDLFTPINKTPIKPKQTGDHFTNDLSQFEAEKRRPFHTTIETAEQNKTATFSHFICSVNSLPKGNDKNIIIEPLLFGVNQIQTIKRFCKTCSRDISHQKNKSLYCSEKYFGKDGKRCRNVEANKQRTIRNNIKKNTKEP